MSSSDTIVQKLNIAPGINKNTTELDAEGAYVSCDKVRFFYGKPEKLGGWQREAVAGSVFGGIARDIHSWIDLNEQKYLAFGTHKKLHIMNGGGYYDITPIRSSVTGNNLFSVASGSNLITVSVFPSGSIAGDYFIITQATASVAGIDLSTGSQYPIIEVGAGHFVFQAPTSATSSASAVGGSAAFDLLLETGLADNGAGFGWGAGTWGTFGASVCAGWSEPRAEAVGLDLRQWTLDHWGEDLIATPKGGKIYLWDATSGVQTRAKLISSAAPSINNIAIVAQEGRHLISFGTHTTSGDFDPLLVRWSDSEDYNVWSAAATNQAGSFRLENGSFIIGVQESRREILVFTDESVYSMRRVGGQFVFSFTDLGNHNGLIGQHAAIDVNGVVYWMGYKSFHMYDGVIRTLPCSVQNFLFDAASSGSVNLDQQEKVFCATNRQYNEIWWFYPSRDSIECDRYVVFNYLENTWYIGTLDRTVWQDTDIFRKPYAFAPDGTLYIHEQGKDDDSSPMRATLQTSFFDLEDGDKLMFVDRIIPDSEIEKEMNYSVNYKKYPQGGTTYSKGTFTVTPTTRKISTRARGRQMQLTYSTSILGGDFRIGADRISMKPDGER